MTKPDLPDLTFDDFAARLAAVSPIPLAPAVHRALFAHYQELRRWNRTVSLIGPGTLDEIFERHYAESLHALPLIRQECREILDVGSGAGFPGLVLAAAAPLARVTLVEARERKWAFLEAAARRAQSQQPAALPSRCLNARVQCPLPDGLPAEIDLITARAIKIEPDVLSDLAARVSAGGQILLWVGRDVPEAPPGWEAHREGRLPGSAERRIVELGRTQP